MKRLIIFLVLLFLILPVGVLSSENKPIKLEQVLKLRNYELGLQNLQLQIEVLNREIQSLKQERDTYVDELYNSYGLNKKWRIDLRKGIWFAEEAPEDGKVQGEKIVE